MLANWDTRPDWSNPVRLGVLQGDCNWDTLDIAGDWRPPDLFLCLVDCGVLGPLANDWVLPGVEGPRPNSIL